MLARHLLGYSEHATTTRWFARPGTRDITSHVDLDQMRRAAAACGLVECGCVDQTYFLTSLGSSNGCRQPQIRARWHAGSARRC